MASKSTFSPPPPPPSLRFGHSHKDTPLLQHFVTPFLHHLHLQSSSSSSSSVAAAYWLTISIDKLQLLHDDLLISYAGSSEDEQTEETRTAEQLIQALYNHCSALVKSEIGAFLYVRIMQKLWELEDQGLILRSSLINDLAVRSLLETHCIKSCRGLIALALQNMFITSSQENKRVLADAVLSAACSDNEIVNLWSFAIVDGVGKSALRLNAIEGALIDKCKSDNHIMNQKTQELLLCCVKSASSCQSFDLQKLLLQPLKALSTLRKFGIQFVRESTIQEDTRHYCISVIKFLRERNSFDIAVQTEIYKAIDKLKLRSVVNIYKCIGTILGDFFEEVDLLRIPSYVKCTRYRSAIILLMQKEANIIYYNHPA